MTYLTCASLTIGTDNPACWSLPGEPAVLQPWSALCGAKQDDLTKTSQHLHVQGGQVSVRRGNYDECGIQGSTHLQV